ncbi:MAG: hypothetical protein Q9198_000914 [Flavoplaca austrocitrina]
MRAELGSQLCEGSSVYISNNPDSRQHTERWSTAAEGEVLIVVAPTCVKDVARAVKFANRINVPFLAINRGHGSVSALGTFKHGVLIKLDNLTSIDIAADGKSAVLGGGVYSDLLLATLAKKNKVAAQRLVAAVASVLQAPAWEEVLACKRSLEVQHPSYHAQSRLGSYQGYAGLMGDNILEMDVVTADGSEIPVSESSNPDLYWAMRGAGQNFGIVTKFRYKIFDYPNGQDIFHATYHFTKDQLEIFFEHLNSLINNGTLPRDVNAYVVLRSKPLISPRPVFVYHFYYFGTSEQASPYTQTILSLNPISVSNATFPYKDVSHRSFQASIGDPTCAAGISTKTRFPVGLQTYNVSTNRKIYNLFEDMITAHPALATSFVQFEAFPMQAVKAVDPASTAYAHRQDDILVFVSPFHPFPFPVPTPPNPTNYINHLLTNLTLTRAFSTQYHHSPANAALATKYGRQARQLFVEGASPMRLNAYSNYANGDETLEEIYGYEPWRLEKLRRLKREWDPDGRFRFFNPIKGY